MDCDGVGVGQAAISVTVAAMVWVPRAWSRSPFTHLQGSIACGGPLQTVRQIPVGGVGGLPGKGHGGATHHRCGCRRVNGHNRRRRARRVVRSWDAGCIMWATEGTPASLRMNSM